jgi:hypothetical protein
MALILLTADGTLGNPTSAINAHKVSAKWDRSFVFGHRLKANGAVAKVAYFLVKVKKHLLEMVVINWGVGSKINSNFSCLFSVLL